MIELTLQQIFDTVLWRLTEQKVASLKLVDRAPTCAYRGKDGNKCAAGWLMLDEHYKPRFENKGVQTPYVARALVASGVPNTIEASHLVSDLQRAHDTDMPWGSDGSLDGFYNTMQIISEKFGLSFSQS